MAYSKIANQPSRGNQPTSSSLKDGGGAETLMEPWKTYHKSNNEFGGQKLGSEAFIWSMNLMDKGNGLKKAPCWSMSLVDKVCGEEKAPFHQKLLSEPLACGPYAGLQVTVTGLFVP